MSGAPLVTPPYDALMLALIFLLVLVVLILKVAELAPAGTVTLAGTIAFVGLVLANVTTTGLLAALFNVTVPTEFEPPTTVVGFKVRLESIGGAAGLTVIGADLFTPE